MTDLWRLIPITLCLSACWTVSSYAESTVAQQDARKVLDEMPPDLLAKVRTLAEMLQQGIKDGKLTEAEIQRGVMSGQLAERLKQLNPEAGQLFEEISAASKQGKGPGEASLLPLVGGLGIPEP